VRVIMSSRDEKNNRLFHANHLGPGVNCVLRIFFQITMLH